MYHLSRHRLHQDDVPSTVACDDAFSDAAAVEFNLTKEVVCDELRWLPRIIMAIISRLLLVESGLGQRNRASEPALETDEEDEKGVPIDYPYCDWP